MVILLSLEGTGNFVYKLCVLEPPDLLPLTFGRSVMNEGSFAQASCIVSEGDEPLSISWSFNGTDIQSDLGIFITPVGSRGSILIINSVGHRHSGNFTCIAKNAAGSKAQTVELKVNGNIIKKSRGRHWKTYDDCF